MDTLVEIDNTTKQATTSKQVEMLFKFIVVLFSSDVAGNYEQFKVEVHQRAEYNNDPNYYDEISGNDDVVIRNHEEGSVETE